MTKSHLKPFTSKIVVFFVILFSITSCITLKEIPEIENTRIIKNVPFYKQDEYKCGPSSLASVLNFWGVHKTPDDISKEIFSKNTRGTLNIDMVLYAQRQGLYVSQYSGNIENIRKNIDDRHPLIVLVDLGFSLYQFSHFMVVVGYNDQGVIVNSGKQKEQFLFNREFLRIWKKTNQWTLLITKIE